MLIDQLQDRFDTVRVIEPDDISSFKIENCVPVLKVHDEVFFFSQMAMDSLLNEIKVPIKYFERLVDVGSMELAEQNVNLWLDNQQIKFVAEDNTLIRVFKSNRLYVPSVLVNDAIIDHLPNADVHSWEITEEGFNATYVGSETKEIGEHRYQLGIRVLYAECSNVTPRFDAILYSPESEILWSVPASNRKFRSAGSNLSRVLEQVREFIDLSRETIMNVFSSLTLKESRVDYIDIIDRICSDIRLSRKVKMELYTGNPGNAAKILDVAAGLNKILSKGNIDTYIRRDIEVEFTQYVLGGRY